MLQFWRGDKCNNTIVASWCHRDAAERTRSVTISITLRRKTALLIGLGTVRRTAHVVVEKIGGQSKTDCTSMVGLPDW